MRRINIFFDLIFVKRMLLSNFQAIRDLAFCTNRIQSEIFVKKLQDELYLCLSVCVHSGTRAFQVWQSVLVVHATLVSQVDYSLHILIANCLINIYPQIPINRSFSFGKFASKYSANITQNSCSFTLKKKSLFYLT